MANIYVLTTDDTYHDVLVAVHDDALKAGKSIDLEAVMGLANMDGERVLFGPIAFKDMELSEVPKERQ